MVSDKNLFLSEIERYIAFLKKLTPQEIEELAAGKKKVEFEIIQKRGAKKQRPQVSAQFDVVSVVQTLSEKQSREEIEDYFNLFEINRKTLEEICRSQDIPFSKKDNIRMLKDKIIEEFIGFKLRSKAIQDKG